MALEAALSYFEAHSLRFADAAEASKHFYDKYYWVREDELAKQGVVRPVGSAQDVFVEHRKREEPGKTGAALKAEWAELSSKDREKWSAKHDK